MILNPTAVTPQELREDTPVIVIAPADLFDWHPTPTVAFDENFKVRACNRAAADLLGMSADEMCGLSLYLFYPHESDSVLKRAWSAVPEHGSWQGELKMIGAGGRLLTVENRWSVAPNGLVLAALNDVSAQAAGRRLARAAAKWSAVRELSQAFLAQIDAGTNLIEFCTTFAVRESAAVASRIDYGAGSSILLTGFAPVQTAIIRTFLERCDYRVHAAESPADATRILTQGGFVRSALVGPLADVDMGPSIHAVRPQLPLLALDTESLDPPALLRTVAEAVAADIALDAALGN